MRGGGYVGVLDEEKRLTRKAVVDAAMHEADIFADAARRPPCEAIGWADILVLDADLAVPPSTALPNTPATTASPCS